MVSVKWMHRVLLLQQIALIIVPKLLVAISSVDGFLLGGTESRFAFLTINRKNSRTVPLWSTAVPTAQPDTGAPVLLRQDDTTKAAAAATDEDSLQWHPQYQPSVLKGSSPMAHTEAWQEALVPRPWEMNNPHARGGRRVVDVSTQWDSQREGTFTVAARLLQQALPAGRGTDEATAVLLHTDLAASLQAFVDFLERHLPPPQHHNAEDDGNLRLSARLVATRGTAGTKCPQWHVDHVPVRWIQSLAGPGCLWVQDNGDDDDKSAICWDRINALDDDDDDGVLDPKNAAADNRNALLIDARRSVVRQAKPGEAVLLLGSEWNGEHAATMVRRPAVHKSPEIRWPWQGRVLLTMDVVRNEKPND